MIRKHPLNKNGKDVNSNQVEIEFNPDASDDYETSLLQLEFVKSALTINPCMVILVLFPIIRISICKICAFQEPSKSPVLTRGR